MIHKKEGCQRQQEIQSSAKRVAATTHVHVFISRYNKDQLASTYSVNKDGMRAHKKGGQNIVFAL